MKKLTPDKIKLEIKYTILIGRLIKHLNKLPSRIVDSHMMSSKQDSPLVKDKLLGSVHI